MQRVSNEVHHTVVAPVFDFVLTSSNNASDPICPRPKTPQNNQKSFGCQRYAALMVEDCPLATWKLNSAIVHATATSAIGPYRFHDEVMPHFAHNPHIQVIPNTRPPVFVLYHIGCGAGGATMNCTGLPVPIPPSKIPSHVNTSPCDSSGWLGMLVSASPNGPWRNVSGPLLIRSGGVAEPQQGLTNPALHFFANGSAIMAYRASADRWPSMAVGTGGKAGEGVGLAFCANYSGPCVDLTPDLPALSAKVNCEPPNEAATGSCEDIAIWPDARGNVRTSIPTPRHPDTPTPPPHTPSLSPGIEGGIGGHTSSFAALSSRRGLLPDSCNCCDSPIHRTPFPQTQSHTYTKRSLKGGGRSGGSGVTHWGVCLLSLPRRLQ